MSLSTRIPMDATFLAQLFKRQKQQRPLNSLIILIQTCFFLFGLPDMVTEHQMPHFAKIQCEMDVET